MSLNALFRPFACKSLNLKNRIVMAPMTRSFSPGGVVTLEVADYYARRASGGVGLIISEGAGINRGAALNDPNAPRFHGEAELAGWQQVLHRVHAGLAGQDRHVQPRSPVVALGLGRVVAGALARVRPLQLQGQFARRRRQERRRQDHPGHCEMETTEGWEESSHGHPGGGSARP